MNGRVETQAGTLLELQRLQTELQQREREVVELGYIRLTDGFESIRDAVRRLGEVGSPRGVLDRAARELGPNTQFDRILISEIVDDAFVPLQIWERDGESAETPQYEIRLGYPMLEYEVASSATPLAILATGGTGRTPAQILDVLQTDSYVVGAIQIEGRSVGLLHADASLSGRPLDEVDEQLVLLACTELGEVLELAFLRETIRRHRAELQLAIDWLRGRLSITTADERASPAGLAAGLESVATHTITAREREVLALMARGQTNAQIARALGIQEGTVKYHVKNLLRKLGARSRADAVARFARATGAAPR